MLPKTTIGQKILPDRGTYNASTSGNQTWNSWASVTAGGSSPSHPAYDFVCCGVYNQLAMSSTATGNTFAKVVGEVGYGASGAEVAKARYFDVIWMNKSAAVESVLLAISHTQFFEPFIIPARSRVAERRWSSGAGILGSAVPFGYWRHEWDEVVEFRQEYERFMRGGRIQKIDLYDPAASTDLGFAVTCHSSAWMYGDWKQIVPEGQYARPLLVRGLAATVSSTVLSNNTAFQVQLGVAAGGGAILPLDVVGVHNAITSLTGIGHNFLLYRPTWVRPGAAVYLRGACAVGSQVLDCGIMAAEVMS